MKIFTLIGIGFITLFRSQISFAEDCSNIPYWNSQQVYHGSANVQFSNSVYVANWWTQGQNPEQFSGPWQVWSLLGVCDGSPSENRPPIAENNGPYSVVVDSPMTFSSAGSADPDGQIAQYLWDFGDGNSSQEENPTHTYLEVGSFNIVLTVTDNNGAAAIDSSMVQVTASGSGDCNGIARYMAGSQYGVGNHVANVRQSDGQTIEYVCDIAGWCSSDAAWAYEPGNGMHWQDAWREIGRCGDAGPQDPLAIINGPYSGVVNSPIQFSSAGSLDPDGDIVMYDWRFGDGVQSSDSNPTHQYGVAGTYTVTLTVMDNDGRTSSASSTVTVQTPGDPGPLPQRLLVGYWHNFINAAGYLPIAQVSADWDIVNLSFAENAPFGQSGEVAFVPAEESDASFRAGVQFLQSRGQKVLMSLGGANAHIQLNTISERDNFIRTMGDIIANYGLDGMDIDLEGGSLNMTSGDTVAQARTPAIVNLISATRAIKARFGSEFILTMAPETAYVQGGYANFGGIWGAYLPLIHALRDDLTLLHVQHYNTGSITGADDVTYQPATVDFHVALSDMMITGFPAGRDPNNFFPGLREDQLAFGLPASAGAASSGQTSVEETQKAMDCLIKQIRCGVYQPAQARRNFRGVMTWSINWDVFNGFAFSQPHRVYLDQN